MFLSKVVRFCAAVSGVTLIASSAEAQTASQLVPQSFRPETTKPSQGFSIPQAESLVAPPGAEKLTVTLRDIKVEGGYDAVVEPVQRLRSKIAGRKVTGADVFAAAQELEEALVREGYALSRIVLPPQKLVNGGILRLILVDGYIERIDVSQVPEPVRDRVLQMLSPLEKRSGVRLPEIERRLLLAGDTPGVILRSTLARGQERGGTILSIDARYQAVGANASIDNSVSKSIGKLNAGIGLDLNSVGGIGDLTYIRLGGYPGADTNVFSQDPLNRSIAAGVVVPLGIDGLSVNGEFTMARSTPRSKSLASQSQFERATLRLRYAFVRSRALNSNLEASFDAASDEQRSLSGGVVPLSRDRTRVMRFSGDVSWNAPWGAGITAKATTSLGLDAFGARAQSDATSTLSLSRQGADDRFQKIDGHLRYTQGIVESVSLDVSGRWQYSFNQPLLKSEQFGIASANGLSTFDSGSLSGDSGWLLRSELSYVWPVAAYGYSFGLAPYLFAATGGVHIYKPTAVEQASTRATSYGLGLRVSAAEPQTPRSASLGLEFGRQQRSDNVKPENRLSISASTQF